MNSIVNTLLRRIPKNFAHSGKQYHHRAATGISKLPAIVQPAFQTERDLMKIIQQTIIPVRKQPPLPILDQPCLTIIGKIDRPLHEIKDVEPTKEILDPGRVIEKRAHRMMIIKRRKMNKHQHKKWKKKYRARWLRRERYIRMKREIAFRHEIHAKLKEAERFDAKEFVDEKLRQYRLEIPRYRIHGVRMPPFVVEDWYKKLEANWNKTLAARERRQKMKAERGSLNVEIRFPKSFPKS